MFNLIKATLELKIKYTNNIIISIKNYFQIKDNNI